MQKKRQPLLKYKKLSTQQLAAVVERAKPECPNNVAAVLVAYPKSKNWTSNTIARFACDLFKKPHVAYGLEKEMDRVRKDVRKATSITAQRIVQEFQNIALASITDVVQYETKKGRGGVDIFVMKITEFDKLDDETKRSMKKIKIRTKPVKVEDDTGDVTWHEIQEIEFEMCDKQRALDSLAKYFDLYVEKVEHHHSGVVGVVHTTMQEMRVLFDSMTPEERERHLIKLTKEMEV
jgi:hypothetical protein